ncbi:ABC transporter substrate-binding protein [Ornithinibacillus contaminans]|uniref:ABC transporter substrate-binding protein n=1 Tax=Ornithinibacillus contaminans TaxID=694055 RepID=UPI00064DA4F2|nr:extracellular solute-binding protein [Ornithinibacillus contaminans]
MKSLKSVLLLVAFAILTLALVACGDKASGGSGDKEILMWSGVVGPDGDLIQKNIDQYNETDPEYPVKLVKMEGQVLNNKLATVTRSGEGVPDIAMIASETVAQYTSQGMLESWDEYIEDTEVKAENYIEEAWNVGTVDGKQYGLPVAMGTWVMYYNKDLVDKYAPGAADDNVITYEEIEQAGEAAKADGIYAYGFSWAMQNFNNLYLQMGGKFADAEGNLTINNDTAVAAMEQFKELYDKGYMNKNGEDTTMLFKNGQIIFMPEGTWMVSEMSTIEGFEWAETFTPQYDAANILQGSGADQFAMFKDENRSEEKIKGTVAFIEWLQANQLEWVKSGANPASLAMLDNEEYVEMPQSFLLKSPEAREAITIVVDEGSSHIFSEIDGAAWDMIEGKVDIKDKLAEIQQTVDDKMAQ